MGSWLIGIDAGGTGTRALAATGGGEGVRHGQAGACNWTTLPESECLASIDGAGSSLRLGSEEVAAVCLCSAGYYPPHHRQRVLAALRERWPGARLRVETDLVGAWAGALALRPGVVLVAGTGSVAYGRGPGGGEARAGGWGPLFDDAGSGFWIACRALGAVARAVDGRGPETRLAHDLLAGADDREEPTDRLRRFLARAPGRDEVAALAPCVFAAAEAGDEVAVALLREAAAELGRMAVAVERRLESADSRVPPGRWSWAGGVLCGSAPLRDWVQEWLEAQGCTLAPVPPCAGPAWGALLLAEEAAGGDTLRRQEPR